jgi:ankyrin repeat protein
LSINALTSSNNSCLHIAAMNGHLEVCKYLIEEAKPHKVDVLLLGLNNETAAEAAFNAGKKETYNYVLEHQIKMQNWRNR